MEEGIEQSETTREVATDVHQPEWLNGSANSQEGEGIVNGDGAIPSQQRQRGASARTYKRRDAKSRVSTAGWFFWSAAFVLTATVSATIGASVALLAPLSPVLAPLRSLQNRQQGDLWRYGFRYNLARPVNILVMGIDRVPNVPDNSPEIFNGRSDTILLLRLDPTDRSVKMLSIPRDTRVEIPGAGTAKINQANVDGGSALAARVISRNLNNVPVDRYVRVTTDAFRELVDLVGGVEVFVPQRMYYTDNTQSLKIDLQPGWQTLNGDQAQQFARFRNDKYGDIGRVQRQQALIKALRQRLVNPTVLPRLPQLVQAMWKYVDTNLSLEETLALVNFGLSLDRDDVKMVMLPGQFSADKGYASYWIIDRVRKDRVMREYFQRESVSAIAGVNRSPNRVRIAIQNATGKPNTGRSVAEYLARKGLKNTYLVADWPDLQQQTQIIVQQGDVQAADTLKKVLGLGKIEAISTGDIESDLTIRVGEDWIPQ